MTSKSAPLVLHRFQIKALSSLARLRHLNVLSVRLRRLNPRRLDFIPDLELVLVCLALVVVTLAVYAQVGSHQFVSYDDYEYVTRNPHVAGGITGNNIMWAFTSVDAANWHPVTWLSHMADVQFTAWTPVVITSPTSLFIFSLPCSFCSSFSVAPVHSGEVPLSPPCSRFIPCMSSRLPGWRNGRMSSARFSGSLPSSSMPNSRRIESPCCTFCRSFLCMGLMSKPMLVTLPVVMLLLDVWPLQRYGGEGQNQGPWLTAGTMVTLVREKIPFFACSLLSGMATIYAQSKGGAINSFDAIPLGHRMENALIAYVKYLGKTLWPQDLAVFYPFPAFIPLWQCIGSLLLLVAVSAVVIKTGRRYPYLPVGWFWFLVTLLPVIGLIQVGSQSMADRYTYLPVIGLFIMIAWGVPGFMKSLPQRKSAFALTACAVVVAAGAVSCQQLAYWQDSIALYRHTLQVTKNNGLIHFNLGVFLVDKGDLDAAIAEFKETLRINPDDMDAHYELGAVYAQKGALDAAIEEFKEVLRINPNDPAAHNSLGAAFARKGEFDAAIGEFQGMLRINPNNVQAQSNLERVFALRGTSLPKRR